MKLIDRNALINRYQEICNGIACMDCPFNKDGCAFEKLILESAVVDAEPIRHGRWINGKCSECGCDKVITKVYRDDEVAWTATYKDNYCPNCGSRMDLDEVEE